MCGRQAALFRPCPTSLVTVMGVCSLLSPSASGGLYREGGGAGWFVCVEGVLTCGVVVVFAQRVEYYGL